MNKKTANNIFVGVLVTVALFFLLFILFNIGGGNGFFSDRFQLYARFPQVKGLHGGSEVALAGLRVGVVKEISIDPRNKELLVILSIEKKFQDRIRKDSTAYIKVQGVLGDKYIEITLGNPDQKVLQSGEEISTAEQEDIFSKGGTLVEEVKRHFHKGGDLENLIRNLNTTATNLVTITNEIKKSKGLYHEVLHGSSGVNFNKATNHLNNILRKIDQGEGTLGALIQDPTIYEDVKTLLGGAKRSSILKYFMRSFIESGSAEKTTGKKPQTTE